MRAILLLLSAIFGTAIAADDLPKVGRFGETMEQCKLRYGPPVRQWGAETTFEKNGFALEIKFHEGRVDQIRYRKLDSSNLTKAEVDALLANISAGPWKASEIFGFEWSCPEGHRAAVNMVIQHDLVIESADLVKREAEKKATQEKDGAARARGL